MSILQRRPVGRPGCPFSLHSSLFSPLSGSAQCCMGHISSNWSHRICVAGWRDACPCHAIDLSDHPGPTLITVVFVTQTNESNKLQILKAVEPDGCCEKNFCCARNVRKYKHIQGMSPSYACSMHVCGPDRVLPRLSRELPSQVSHLAIFF